MTFDISPYFDVDKDTYIDKCIVVYKFKDGLTDKFVSEYILPFRRSYISDEELKSGIDEKIWASSIEGVAMHFPSKPYLQSGEFSEILLYFISLCMRCQDANIAPLKWRWKENQDTPCHLTDIVIAKCKDEQNPSVDDYLYFVESKAAATPLSKTSTSSVMNDGIEDAVKDSVSRIGKTIPYLITKYTKEKEYEKARLIKRFRDSVDVVEYKRYSNAAIVVDSESLDIHMKNLTKDNLKQAQKHTISLFAVPIKDMKALYERVYAESLKV